MKWEIKAKTGVHLLCFGKILSAGKTITHLGELPDEVKRARQQGLVSVTRIDAKEPAKPKSESKKEEKKSKVELPDNFDDLSRDELDGIAKELGLKPEDYSNKAKIKAAIKKAI